MEENTSEVRLDKWLWAARFYRTRSIARDMIDGGKVRYNGYHVKPGRLVETGARITLRQGFNELEVIVRGISDVRRQASLAQLLYEETQESREKREKNAELHRINALLAPHPDDRPNKKERRTLISFKHAAE
ncbi:ribosome-associated heat shock protein Hsp15 [Succinimonas sp.]|jgi:ribosome-associated heat shock protein Hsp15|uniref:ribosome-associated heat shock protein Hsp15 n=1 Tax=Succinimonas sp. TaxID=1936151 RepID=UPI00386CDD05|nr:ribosome-associated heat shock protein Hsp15 [Succinimonas sp.]